MRYGVIVALVLAGCTLGGGRAEQPTANPITGDEISVTSLDGGGQPALNSAKPGGVVAAPKVEAKPETAQSDVAKADPAKTKPAEAPKPEAAKILAPEVLACQKQGGEWVAAGGEGAMACIEYTRDYGKSCHKKSDCQGDCLAKSNSCAPITPLYGCNDILQDDGSMVTLCID
jgi:hypothetical protein